MATKRAKQGSQFTEEHADMLAELGIDIQPQPQEGPRRRSASGA